MSVDVGVSVQGSLSKGSCPGRKGVSIFVVSVQWVSIQGVSVQKGDLCPGGGLCPGGDRLCPGGGLCLGRSLSGGGPAAIWLRGYV